jgi:hypothetical protein
MGRRFGFLLAAVLIVILQTSMVGAEILAPPDAAPAQTAPDVVTLKDGRVIYGNGRG